MFIAFASIGAVTANGIMTHSGAGRLLAACVFPGGLAMVLVAGSELFTGNCLITVSVLSGEVKLAQMLRNWVFVYIGNFVGSMIVVLLVVYSGQLEAESGALAAAAVKTAASKCSLSFGRAVMLGILCNILVCTAVWMSFAAKTVACKILSCFFPVMLFVLCGFEHSVANMFFIPAGLLASKTDAFLAHSGEIANLGNLTVENFFMNNLIPVTIGNIIGGCVVVAGIYWFVYIGAKKK